MTSVHIRDATPLDLPAMRAAKDLAGRAAWAHFLPEHVIASFGFPSRWEACVHELPPRASALVAKLDSSVVGFAITRASQDDDATSSTGELDGFYVTASAWGRGVGRALLEAATSRLVGAGFERATLWTARENDRPRRIYERAGWTIDGAHREREASGVGYVELRYARAIS